MFNNLTQINDFSSLQEKSLAGLYQKFYFFSKEEIPDF
jgi:hypothetical protein